MQVHEITSFLEGLAPLSYQEDYDNAGLIVGSSNMEVSKALLCLDSTPEVIEEAISEGANLVIAHHPILFSGLKRLNGNTYVERAIISAVKNDIAIYAVHTNLDSVARGVNGKICEKLGLKNCRVLSPRERPYMKLYTYCPTSEAEKIRAALFESGAGHIGDYDECSFNVQGVGTFRGGEGTDPHLGEPGKHQQVEEVRIELIFPVPLKNKLIHALKDVHPYEEPAFDIVSLENSSEQIGFGMIGELEKPQAESDFLQMLKTQMEASHVRHTELLGRAVKKVAVCGGAGAFLLHIAIKQGADAFVSADFKYHQFFDADGKILIADIGHYESEHFTTELIYEILTKNFPNFAVLFSKKYTNPIKHL